MHEYGVYTWPDGTKYVDHYVKDKKEGTRIFIWDDG